jgi:hypothetical protein
MLSWQTVGGCWSNHFSTHGIVSTSGMVPRGLDMGCHMAPYFIGCLKLYGVQGDRTPDLPPWWSAFTRRGLPIAHALVLIIYMVLYIFKFELCCGLGMVWARAKPQPPIICGFPYDHTACAHFIQSQSLRFWCQHI